jgi:hypothetical protein
MCLLEAMLTNWIFGVKKLFYERSTAFYCFGKDYGGSNSGHRSSSGKNRPRNI